MGAPASAQTRIPLTRARIAAAARRQLEAVGLAGLSLREVARSLDVTAAALYAHVDGKRGLLAAVAEEAFDELGARFAAIAREDPIDQLRAQCHAYVEFALDSPHIYQVMMSFEPQLSGVADPERETDLQLEQATSTFASAMGAVEAAVNAGLLVLDDPMLIGLILWSSVHGIVGSLTSGLDIPAEVRHGLVEAGIDTTIRGLLRSSAVV